MECCFEVMYLYIDMDWGIGMIIITKDLSFVFHGCRRPNLITNHYIRNESLSGVPEKDESSGSMWFQTPWHRLCPEGWAITIYWFWLLGWLINKGATCTRICPLWIYTSNGTARSSIWRSQVKRQKPYDPHEHQVRKIGNQNPSILRWLLIQKLRL